MSAHQAHQPQPSSKGSNGNDNSNSSNSNTARPPVTRAYTAPSLSRTSTSSTSSATSTASNTSSNTSSEDSSPMRPSRVGLANVQRAGMAAAGATAGIARAPSRAGMAAAHARAATTTRPAVTNDDDGGYFSPSAPLGGLGSSSTSIRVASACSPGYAQHPAPQQQQPVPSSSSQYAAYSAPPQNPNYGGYVNVGNKYTGHEYSSHPDGTHTWSYTVTSGGASAPWPIAFACVSTRASSSSSARSSISSIAGLGGGGGGEGVPGPAGGDERYKEFALRIPGPPQLSLPASPRPPASSSRQHASTPSRPPPPPQLPHVYTHTSVYVHMLYFSLPPKTQPEMITISANKPKDPGEGERIKVVGDLYESGGETHFEFQVQFPPHDVDMGDVHAKFDTPDDPQPVPGARGLRIEVRRRLRGY